MELTIGDSMDGHADGQHVPLPEEDRLHAGDGNPELNPAAPPFMQGSPPAEFWQLLIQQLANNGAPRADPEPQPCP